MSPVVQLSTDERLFRDQEQTPYKSHAETGRMRYPRKQPAPETRVSESGLSESEAQPKVFFFEG